MLEIFDRNLAYNYGRDSRIILTTWKVGTSTCHWAILKVRPITLHDKRSSFTLRWSKHGKWNVVYTQWRIRWSAKTKNCTRGYRLNENYHKAMRDVISWRKGLSCMCETSNLHETLEYHQCYIEFVVNQLCGKKKILSGTRELASELTGKKVS